MINTIINPWGWLFLALAIFSYFMARRAMKEEEEKANGK
jgi:hypothetical protein